MIRWYLIGVLLFLPFQRKMALLASNPDLSYFITYLDEITIIVFLPLAIVRLYTTGNIKNPLCLALLFSVFFLVLSGFISGFVNGNSLITTMAGIFDYTKNFLVVFIYLAFFTELREFKKILRLLLAIAVVLGAIAFIQELWALSSVYIFGKDIDNPNNYVFQKETGVELLKNYWRFGIFRTSSLMVSTINSGLYSLLILNIYLCITKKVNYAVIAALFSGIFTSVSRIVYMGFVFVAGLQIFRGRRWLVILFIPVLILLLFMGSYRDLNVSKIINSEMKNVEDLLSVKGVETESAENNSIETNSQGEHFRESSRKKALEIWKDHPLWGVGPGMFGGVVSLMFNSHIYNEYNFKQENYLRLLKSIDSFWSQVMAEMGIVGILAFSGLLLTTLALLFILRKRTSLEELKGLSTGLIIYMMVVVFYTVGLGLNIPAVFYTYCALTGIGFGCMEKT